MQVTTDSQRVKDGPQALKVTVTADGDGNEDYPKLSRTFDAPNDWSDYHKVECWVYVECDDPNVASKDFGIVFYPRRVFKQQFVHHSVPVNEWVFIRDWITGYERDDISEVDIYLYETQPDVKHTYTWWIDGLKLVGLKEGVVSWDQGVLELADKAPSPKPGPAKHTVNTADGLALGWDAAGRIASVRLDGKEQAPVQQTYHSGLLLKEAADQSKLMPLSGRLSLLKNVVTQTDQQEGFAIETRYTGGKDAVEVQCQVKKLRPAEDRGVSLYFALPVEGKEWQWWDDTVATRSTTSKLELYTVMRDATFGANGSHSYYPMCAVGNAATGEGLAMAIRMDEPRIYRFTYNPFTRQLFVVFDLGLTAATKKSPNQATFRFYLYRIDGKWGMRSAAERYYRMFPEFFERRAKKDGGWTVWGSTSKLEKAEDFGYAYDWGPTADAAKWDNEHGLYAFHYLEAEFHQHPMSDYDRTPTRKECINRLNFVADPNRTEPLPKLVYYQSGCGNIDGSCIADVNDFNRKLAQATQKSGIRDEKGELQFAVGPAPWVGDKGIRAHFFCNLDPEIPGGRGQFDFDKYLRLGFERWNKLGVRMDGMGFDSFNGFGVNALGDWSKEHFAYADVPPTFDAKGYKPVMPMAFSTYEWLLEWTKRFRPQGQLIIANWWSHYPFSAPLFDILGSESASFYPDKRWARLIAYHKPLSDLPYEAREEAWVKEHLLLGIFPGESGKRELYAKYVPLIRRLAEAGWEPVTHAWNDSKDVWIERFGDGKKGEVFFSVDNSSKEKKTVVVSIDMKSLMLLGKDVVVTDIVNGAKIPAEIQGDKLVLHVELVAEDTTAVDLTGSKL